MSRKSITLILLMLTIIVLLPPFAVLASGHNRETSGVETVVSASDFVRGYANQLVRASARTDVDTVKQHENHATEKGTHSVAFIEDHRQRDENSKSEMMEVLGASSAAISAGEHHICLFSEIGLTKSWGDNPYGRLVEGMTVENGLNWQIEIADSGIGHGSAAEVSLSLDDTGAPHVSYADWSNGYDTLLRYSHRTLSGWDAQAVPFYGSMQGVASSLALDRGNNPHIAYQNGNQDLLHMWWSGGQWNVNTIGWGPLFGSDISLALDNDDTPHVSFYSGYPDYFGLRYGYWTGSNWSIQTADGPGNTGKDSSLALDQSGNPHISYCGVDNDSVRYAVWTGAVWNTSTVTQFTSGKCVKTSLALDTAGDPRIGYAVNSGSVYYEVRYAWLTDDGWEEELVDDGGGLGVSMSLDSSNVPHLSYYEETSGALLYSSRTQNDWYMQLVDDGADQFGLDTSISVEKSGVHIAYYMPTDSDPASVQLRYAFLPLYNISGRITDSLGNPISDVEVNDGNGHTFLTDADGSYGFLGLEAGTYTIIPKKTGYKFNPPFRTIILSQDMEDVDYRQAPPSALVYNGPLYLPDEQVMVGMIRDEGVKEDGRIVMGEHVLLKLPFVNNGSETISSPEVTVCSGKGCLVETPIVWIFQNDTWATHQTVPISSSPLNPGETGYAEFWAYIENVDPDDRVASYGTTWLTLQIGEYRWEITIQIEPIDYDEIGKGDSFLESMKGGSCLHHPDDLSIKTYAQYAAGTAKLDAPNDENDPDSPAQAVRNLVDTVHTEFGYLDMWDTRMPDVVLIGGRRHYVGVCRDYADLTVGLLRSLSLPTRTLTASLKMIDRTTEGHAWAESWLDMQCGENEDYRWCQADSTWGVAIDQQGKAESRDDVDHVTKVWAEKYPLASASTSTSYKAKCITSCYDASTPSECQDCQEDSLSATQYTIFPEGSPDLSCVDDVTSTYHQSQSNALSIEQDATLFLTLDSPTAVTLNTPFNFTTTIINTGAVLLADIDVTVSAYEYVDSTEPLFEVTPDSQTISELAPDSAMDLQWTATPLVEGTNIPLAVSAFSDSAEAEDAKQLTVNTPGTLPDLSLTGTCVTDVIEPGGTVTITASVVDENLQPFSDPDSVSVKATVFITPTQEYSTTVALLYCESCEAYQTTIDFDSAASIGTYEVDISASHPEYDPDSAINYFRIIPPLEVMADVNRNVLDLQDTLRITTTVSDRSTPITEAAVWATIVTPGGSIDISLTYDAESEYYSTELRPSDLQSNFEGINLAGAWDITVHAEYEGGNGETALSIHVVDASRLAELSITYDGSTYSLSWPDLGEGIDHYELYRSTIPHFLPGDSNSELVDDKIPRPAGGEDVIYTDQSAFDPSDQNYYYGIVAVDTNSYFYVGSKNVGRFVHELTPGME